MGNACAKPKVVDPWGSDRQPSGLGLTERQESKLGDGGLCDSVSLCGWELRDGGKTLGLEFFLRPLIPAWITYFLRPRKDRKPMALECYSTLDTHRVALGGELSDS
jgi:hypothetical protein